MSAKVAPYPHAKSFSPRLFAKHDGVAKEVVKSLLTQMGYTVINEDEAYSSHDFIVAKEGVESKVEVEQKTAWKYEMFPFATHNVSYRKVKSNADLFFQISANEKYVAMCPMSVVKASPIKRINTCLGTSNEPFFDVPCSAMRYFSFEDGVWYETTGDV
jgi:hypothetical protein